jgi:hypothetical protein
MNINEEYQEIISKCKFISKTDEWFIEGCECDNEDKCSYSEYKDGDKFNNGWSLFHGLTLNGVDGDIPELDGETCPFDEFFIYDEHGNEISEWTLTEYKEKYK